MSDRAEESINYRYVCIYVYVWGCTCVERVRVSRSSRTSVPSDFLVEGQVSELGTVHPLLNLHFFTICVVIRYGMTPEDMYIYINSFFCRQH